MQGTGRLGMRTAVTLLVGSLTLSVAVHAHAGTLEAVKKRGTLIVGVRNDFPPLGYIDADGKNAGFEVDLARYMARQLLGDENKLRAAPVPPGSRITLLLSGSADMLIAAVTATEDRASVFNFSEPYFISGSLLLVPKNSPIKNLEDVKGKRVAVIEGSIQEGDVERSAPEATRVKFWRVPEAVEALQTGKVEAFAQDDVLVLALAKQNPGLTAVGKPFMPRPYAIAMSKGDRELLEWVNGQLRRARADGTYDKLWSKYFGDAGAVLVRP